MRAVVLLLLLFAAPALGQTPEAHTYQSVYQVRGSVSPFHGYCGVQSFLRVPDTIPVVPTPATPITTYNGVNYFVKAFLAARDGWQYRLWGSFGSSLEIGWITQAASAYGQVQLYTRATRFGGGTVTYPEIVLNPGDWLDVKIACCVGKDGGPALAGDGHLRQWGLWYRPGWSGQDYRLLRMVSEVLVNFNPAPVMEQGIAVMGPAPALPATWFWGTTLLDFTWTVTNTPESERGCLEPGNVTTKPWDGTYVSSPLSSPPYQQQSWPDQAMTVFWSQP